LLTVKNDDGESVCELVTEIVGVIVSVFDSEKEGVVE